MKIGILTLHYGCNYGGVLQSYALLSYLTSQGHSVEIIDFIPNERRRLLTRILGRLKTIASPKDLINTICDCFKTNQNRNEIVANNKQEFISKFEKFRKERLKLSERVDEKSITALAHNYEAVIVGSDQVWTLLYSKYHTYFFDWIPQNSPCRIISYAACSAHSFVKGNTKKELRHCLSKFYKIGVRDNTTYELVKSINPTLEPQIVLDPTALWTFKEFEDSTKETKEKYIFTYILGTEIKGGHKKALTKIKSQVGDLKVISIMLPESASNIENYSDEIITNASPEQWVNYIRNATFIYTDSFHGIMFSLKFRKQFLAYYANVIRASRLIDLKKRFSGIPIVDNADSPFEHYEPQELNTKSSEKFLNDILK